MGKLVIVPKPTQGLEIYGRLTGACCHLRPRQSVVSACNTDECDTASALSYDKIATGTRPVSAQQAGTAFSGIIPG